MIQNLYLSMNQMLITFRGSKEHNQWPFQNTGGPGLPKFSGYKKQCLNKVDVGEILFFTTFEGSDSVGSGTATPPHTHTLKWVSKYNYF